MLGTATMYGVIVDFTVPQTPSYAEASGVSKVKYPPESVLTGVYRETIFFKVRAEEKYGPEDG